MTKKYSQIKRKKKITPQTDYFLLKSIDYIDYKDTENLRKFLNKQGRIVPRLRTQLTAKNQRKLSKAIKRSRQMALLPYTRINQNE